MEIHWVAYYKFPHDNIRTIHTDDQFTKLLLWDSIGRSTSWWWPFENICICSERPLEIHKKGIQLHRDGGPAFVSRDGWKMWYLNGVNVPQQIAELSENDIDPRLILTEKNAEVRREIIRKIGIERVFEALEHKVIDEQGEYSLLDINLGERFRPYLKMKNPSIGVYHIEGVHPDCRTVEQALNWRNQTTEKPTILT